ncbi:MAG: hypothetical protein AB8G99_24215 [Planctomycetaceae bacterium]
MNQVSKLLIILQLFLSIMFMAFAAAVFQTNKSWKTAADENATQLQQAQTSLTNSQNERDRLVKEQSAALKAAEEQSATYLAQYNAAKTALDEVVGVDGGDVGELAKARIEANVAQAESKIATEEAAARVAEAKALREEAGKLRSQVDSLVADGRKKDDTILEQSRQLAAAISKDKVDQETIARLSTIIRVEGLNPRARIDPSGQVIAEGREPVELVNGKVLRTKRSGRLELVSISLGQDDAVEVGNRLHVYRGAKFLGDIILREVNSDSAVGVVDEKFRNGMIQRDDNVTSKL